MHASMPAVDGMERPPPRPPPTGGGGTATGAVRGVTWSGTPPEPGGGARRGGEVRLGGAPLPLGTGVPACEGAG